jgi:hypothetical protein
MKMKNTNISILQFEDRMMDLMKRKLEFNKKPVDDMSKWELSGISGELSDLIHDIQVFIDDNMDLTEDSLRKLFHIYSKVYWVYNATDRECYKMFFEKK